MVSSLWKSFLHDFASRLTYRVKWKNDSRRTWIVHLSLERALSSPLDEGAVTALWRLALVFIVPCGGYAAGTYQRKILTSLLTYTSIIDRLFDRQRNWSAPGVQESNLPFLTTYLVRMSVSSIETYAGTFWRLKYKASATMPIAELWWCGFAPHMKPGT